MDESSYAIIIFSLIAVKAFITMAYVAITNTRMSSLREQADDGSKRAQRVINLLEGRSQLTVSYDVSNALLYFAIAAFTTLGFIQPMIQNDPSNGALLGAGLGLTVAALTLIFSHIVPEGIGSSYAEPLALFLMLPLRLVLLLLYPLTWLLLLMGRFIANIFGGGSLVNTVTEEEIMTLVNAGHTGGTIEEEEKDMIYSVLQLSQTWSRELMVPRLDIVAVDVETSIDDALERFISSGFSRIPIFEETIDNIVGLLYAKDLLRGKQYGNARSIRDLLRPAYFVPETLAADDLLRQLQNRKVHMAIVVDEYGGTSGLVTIENLIEEIVGDIRDEYDQNEDDEYVQKAEGEYLIDGSMDIDDLNELMGLSINNEDTDTLAGYIYMILGRVPEIDETIETDQFILQVRSIEGRRIRQVHVKLKHPSDGDGPDGDKPETGKELPAESSAEDADAADSGDTTPRLADAS